MRLLASFALLTGLFCNLVYGQVHLILNNGVYMVVRQGASVVLDNGEADALMTMGSGGYLVSEGEYNSLKWNIGEKTGVYVVPFVTNPLESNTAIPLKMEVTSPGTGEGFLSFSTYESNDDNMPYPEDVTNMGIPDLSLAVMDRFWVIDAGGYDVNPGVVFRFAYSDADGEMGGTNMINENNLRAYGFSTTMNTWTGGVGFANTENNAVEGVVVTAQDFYRSWVLADGSSSLSQSEGDTAVSFVVFPNPVRGAVRFGMVSSEEVKVNIQLYDAVGHLLYDRDHVFSLVHKWASVDMSAYASGVYYIKVFDASGLALTRAIVKH